MLKKQNYLTRRQCADSRRENMNYDFQRASMLKRIPAGMLDIILLITLATGPITGLSYVLDMDTHTRELDAIYVRYEEEFDVDFAKTEGEFAVMSEEELARYEAAAEALSNDAEAKKAYEMVLNLTLVMLSGGILAAFLLLEFAVPLWLKNGQTLGKKIFGVALMRKDGVKITPFMMFARTILGKYTVETMIPVFLLVAVFFGIMGLEGLIGFALILIAQVIVAFATRNKTGIHDLLACTVAVDLSSQMIFNSPEEQLEYHKQLHEENIAGTD